MEQQTKQINPETGTVYSRQKLHDAFSLIQNKDNWKLPINSLLPQDADAQMFREAVIFFAGCTPNFSTTFTKSGRKVVRIMAKGYYKAVGA